MKALQVGLLGFGTVGRGTWDVLRRNEEEITRRAGRPIRITWIATRTLDRAREGLRGVEGVNLTNDPHVVARHPDLDIVCELIGGVDAARVLILDAIAHPSTSLRPTRRCSRITAPRSSRQRMRRA